MQIITTDENNYHKRELKLDNDICVSLLYVIDLEMRIGGTPVTMGGIGGVYTNREYRNKGYMRMLYEDTVTYMLDRGYCISTLFGIENFYTKWGYASSLANYLGRVKIRDAEAAKDQVKSIKSRPVTAEDMAAVVDLYNLCNANRSGSLVRYPENFTEFERGADWGHPTAPILWEDDQRNLIAYAVLDNDSKAVRISEVEAVDDSFYATILYYLVQKGIDKRCESILMKLPPDHPFAEYTQRYGSKWEMNFPRHGNGMMRIINQQALFKSIVPALEQRIANSSLRGYSGLLTIKTDLGMTHLNIIDGKIHISDNDSDRLLFNCQQDKLMQLLVGYRTVRDVINDDKVYIKGDGMALLNVLFPNGIPFMYMADHF